MERHILKKILILVGFSFLFLSCGEVRASYHVALGNYSYAQGTYQKANLNYFIAQDLEIDRDIVDYNLGTVFFALGESLSAGELWDGVDPGEDQELAFRLVYNLGILNYRNGEYHAAYEGFKSALFLDSTSLEAKTNLEHSLAKMNAREAGSPDIAPGASPPGAGSEDIQRVLEYIKRQEPVHPPRRQDDYQSSGEKDW